MKKKITRKPRKRAITADDLSRLRLITAAAISGDEKRIAYTVERMDADANKYFANIFMCDVATGKSTAFTHGDHNDGGAVWSPDDSTLAFVSTRDKKTAIYTMPAGGGAEKKLVDLDGAISDLQWTPDGRKLVFALRYNDSYYIKDEKKKKEPPVYRHITELWYRFDGLGFLPKDKFQVHTFDIETGKLKQLTKGKRDNHMPSVSPDGKWVVYVSNRSRVLELNLMRDDLFVVSIDGGRERKVPAPAGPKGGPRFSPNGKLIAYVGHDNPKDAWGVTNLHVWVVGVSGRPAAKDLMPKYDRMVIDQSIADMSDFHDSGTIRWSSDGKRIYFASSDTGVTNFLYVPVSGGKPTRVFKGNCHIKGFSINGPTRNAALIYADLDNPGDLMVCPTTYNGEKKAKQLTDMNPFLRTEVKLGRTRDVSFKSADGTVVNGWLVTPPDFKPSRKYPAILEIHGGPRAQYAYTFFHEMQYLAANGYVVLYTNPRGGGGQGETWSGSIIGDWGSLDYQDCMAAADYLESRKFVNPKRVGVTGGSYGGYMTNWMIGHTNRFKAAVTQRSVVDLVSFVGSSDMGFDLLEEFDGWPWTNPQTYERCSPITYYKNVKTPVLIIHSEQDLRCGIEQAERMFAMLKILGKTVEFVRFPDEPHGLSRHGRPDRRKARLEFILKWFNKYMKR